MQTDPETPLVERRLATVERQHRLLTITAIAAIALAVVSLAAPNALVNRSLPKPRSIEAQAFVLVDGAGRQRAALRVGPDGAPSLTLADNNERTRVSLVVDAANDARLDLADESGKSRASLTAKSQGAPFLAFIDQHDALRAGLMLQADGSPAFLLMDNEGHGRAALSVRPDGSPSVCIVGGEHEPCREMRPVTSESPERLAADDGGVDHRK